MDFDFTQAPPTLSDIEAEKARLRARANELNTKIEKWKSYLLALLVGLSAISLLYWHVYGGKVYVGALFVGFMLCFAHITDGKNITLNLKSLASIMLAPLSVFAFSVTRDDAESSLLIIFPCVFHLILIYLYLTFRLSAIESMEEEILALDFIQTDDYTELKEIADRKDTVVNMYLKKLFEQGREPTKLELARLSELALKNISERDHEMAKADAFNTLISA